MAFQSVACFEKVRFVLIAEVGGRVVENNKVFFRVFLFIYFFVTALLGSPLNLKLFRMFMGR